MSQAWAARVFSTIAALALGVTSLSAAESAKAILILDASGSMWGVINGRTKIEIAREAVAKVVEGLDPSVQLGLMAYGHRRKGDCEDIELLIPPGPVNKQAFLDKVNSLKPLGNTPLTKAVEMAADILKSNENPATVILVSDGLETCGGDPCALANKLESTGVKFTTHVVAFDLSIQESRKIDCLAKDTGGMFLPASDANTLQRALSSAMQSVAQVKSGASFIAKNARTGDALDGASWVIKKTSGAQVAASDKSTFTQDLEPGAYTATASWRDQLREVPFEVKQGFIQPVEASFGPAIIRLVAAESPDAPPLTKEDGMMFWSVSPILADGTRGEEIKDTRDDEPLLELPAGKYEVKFDRGANVNRGSVAQTEIIEVKDGETRTIKVIAAAGTMVITTSYGGVKFPDDGSQPWVEAYAINAQGEVSSEVAVNISEQPVTALLAPGKYEVRSVKDGAKASARIEVKTGVKDEMTLDFAAGYVDCSVTIAGKVSDESWWWYAYAVDAEGKRDDSPLYYVSAANPHMLLPEGTIEIVREANNEPAGSVRVKVEKGKVVKATVQAP